MTSSEGNIADYLADEVLAYQFPAVRTFLLHTSIMDRFCAPLCEAVIGEVDSAWGVHACLDWVERAELFITPLDNRREWYSYHHLFRDLLRLRLSIEIAPEQINDLHCRASDWFERQGLGDEALHHALLANDHNLSAGLMGQSLREVLNREDRPTLERWLHLLPVHSLTRQSPLKPYRPTPICTYRVVFL
jgi:LuxR family maltose regulon positive regulatory protein